ncbi:MAG: hypothetical protein BMS9Abin05_0330 [Rhodothermia bacterium]|nr:MAG: hypothetical protein BMS9Abin05_0330 [Rhodothermia bacterium]
MLQEYYGDLASRYKLTATGGSDFHGWSDEDEENLGNFFARWPDGGNLFRPRTL